MRDFRRHQHQAPTAPVGPIDEGTGAPPIAGLDPGCAETRGDRRVRVAILDGPVDVSHPCFAGAAVTTVETLVPAVGGRGAAAMHGTHVASILFAQPGRSSICGMAPRCSGLIVPIFADAPDGSIRPCSQLDLARAVLRAVEAGAHVINVSAGQFTPGGAAHPFLADAVRHAVSCGVLVVAAVGNDGCACLHVPGAMPSVLAVGAADDRGRPLSSSNWGGPYQTQGILAPGEHILGAALGGGVVRRCGTSFATAIVSGAAALGLSLLAARGRPRDAAAVRAALLHAAVPCKPRRGGDCDRFLAGRLDLGGALALLLEGGPRMAEVIDAEPQVMSPATPDAGIEEAARLSASHATVCPAGADEPRPADPGAPEERTVAPAAAPARPEHEAEAPDAGPPRATAQVRPAACACGGGQPPQIVYALGELAYDFGTEARRDSFAQALGADPNDPARFLEYLDDPDHRADAAAVTWTLNLDATAIYAIKPDGAFAATTYDRIREFYGEHVVGKIERVSVPGVLGGQATLFNGQVVPVIRPALRGMHSWTSEALIQAVHGANAGDEDRDNMHNFLARVYHEVRNLGVSPQDRAINYAATNAYHAHAIFERAGKDAMELDSIDVERSPICRPQSDCWDVKLTFFDPTKRFERARIVHRFTVDVSDVIPVTVGDVRSWSVY